MSALQQVRNLVLGIALSFIKKGARPKDIAVPLAELYAKDIIARQQYSQKQGASVLNVEVDGEIRSVAKCLSWMLPESGLNYGQQAAKVAKKTLRGLQEKKLDRLELINKIRDFKRYRNEALQKIREDKPWGLEWKGRRGRYFAFKVNDRASLYKTGRDFQNCLSGSGQMSEYTKRYISRLQKSEEILIAVYKDDLPCFLIMFDRDTKLVVEVKGPENSCPSEHSHVIMSLLRFLRVKAGSCSDSTNLEIND